MSAVYIRKNVQISEEIAAHNTPCRSLIFRYFFIERPLFSVKAADCISTEIPPNPRANEHKIMLKLKGNTDVSEKILIAFVTSDTRIKSDERMRGLR